MKIRSMLMGAALFALPAVAAAQEGRDLCPDRPGLGTPPCTVEPGRVVAELGLGDWTHEKDAASRTDTVEAGDLLVRFGLTDRLEAQLGWTAYGHERVKDRASGLIDRSEGVGDMFVGVKRNLRNPDGSGFSVALLPYATLPTGGSTIGAGDWGAGLLVPVSYELGKGVALEATPEVDAAVDEDRHGRHLAWGSVMGVNIDVSDAVSATVETSLMRDDDPSGHSTEALAGLSLAWQPGKAWQIDGGVNLGLNPDSPDRELYVGIVRRF
ncbi:transporter [Sphingobium amiense]|uniref:Transporter n=1 Tax=Sphingobium amiense TaxID=135719 RepID=A0A494VWD2_9SPHN|nr:transporter [Sphingobium amiense]BBD96713.1 transporter [Sphingobium amiense]